ncbi:MAG TPA: sodium:solute symporter family protein [Bryobacteraceae bacterium]|nr:sodium:solute symporter family protein [Bryobacteraceae bacterium]
MIPTLFVLAYLAIVLYIGIFAFRRSQGQAEDYFLAGRSLGPWVFVLSLFGTHMTAFAILGSSGHAFNFGIVTFGLMASSSAIVVPVLLLFLGTRLWAVGKRFGHITPVQIFRDRWECGHIGTLIFFLQAALLVPYIIIGVMGGGTTLSVISNGLIPFWAGGLLVAAVVMSYVFFGGMRGTAWVNAFQTVLFLTFGLIAVVVIGNGMGGFSAIAEKLLADAKTASLLSREKYSPLAFLSYTFNPLSAIAFPHIAIFCLTAKKMDQFKKTVVLYPLCILLIWLPCVCLGVFANQATEIPAIAEKVAAKFATGRPVVADDVMLQLLAHYAPQWLAGLLGAGIMAAVMASDSQILALSTMFTEDVFAFYGAREKFGPKAQIATGRLFIVLVTAFAYVTALKAKASIFDLAVQFSFAGFSAMMPLYVGALCWKRSTKWGALAAILWVAAATVGLFFTPRGFTVFGLLPVVPMTLGSAFLLWSVSLLTPQPSSATVGRYFPDHSTE